MTARRTTRNRRPRPGRPWSRLPPVGAAILLGALAACGSGGQEQGVLPQEGAPGKVAALEYDAGTGRLLKATAHALYQSADGGATWDLVPVPAAAQDGRITAVAVPAEGSGALYIAGPGIGVRRSDDSGRTWVRSREGLPSQDVQAFAAHATEAGTLFASIPDHGIFRSEDAGESWKRMDGGPGAQLRTFFHSDMPGSMKTGWLFAATPEGVRRSMDCFCGWRPAGALPAGEVLDVAYDPRQPEHVYAATDAGLFRSMDGGEAWEAVSTAGPDAVTLAIDAEGGAIYAATRDGTLVRSLDQGASWNAVGA